ncbi:AAA family ATPase [Arthrobacter sp. H-02-3]|uniref:AAA family ATPase n=1 Tax=Arthrobacter sp. H-02-3 TaxID=2703675 RepID=UPI001F23C3BD|nr:AAA family ATPase [Arthrobacter sp. H-02-3]
MGTRNTVPVVTYGDVAGLLSGTLPKPPAPSCLFRSDGAAVFYSGQVNMLFGEPESGKTWVALAAVAESLSRGRSAAVVDLDHNGMASTVTRLLGLGAPIPALSDLATFRYKEPEDKADLMATVTDLRRWAPSVVVIDSIGELLPVLNLNSNSPDDFTIAHSHALKPLAHAGCCVIVIDHVAKNPETKGPTGTAAKLRAVGGASLRVRIKDSFAPGRGGSCYLGIQKDRHGGLRAATPAGEKEPVAGVFELTGDCSWTVWAPTSGDRVPDSVPGADLASLKSLAPGPVSVRDIKDRLGWGGDRATLALRVYRQQLETAGA